MLRLGPAVPGGVPRALALHLFAVCSHSPSRDITHQCEQNRQAGTGQTRATHDFRTGEHLLRRQRLQKAVNVAGGVIEIRRDTNTLGPHRDRHVAPAQFFHHLVVTLQVAG